jgi:hypothetical protein
MNEQFYVIIELVILSKRVSGFKNAHPTSFLTQCVFFAIIKKMLRNIKISRERSHRSKKSNYRACANEALCQKSFIRLVCRFSFLSARSKRLIATGNYLMAHKTDALLYHNNKTINIKQ